MCTRATRVKGAKTAGARHTVKAALLGRVVLRPPCWGAPYCEGRPAGARHTVKAALLGRAVLRPPRWGAPYR